MMKSEWVDFAIRQATDNEGTPIAVASRPGMEVAVVGEGGKLFHRRAVRVGASGRTEDTMLVAELDGVRAYLQNGTLLLTKEDIYL